MIRRLTSSDYALIFGVMLFGHLLTPFWSGVVVRGYALLDGYPEPYLRMTLKAVFAVPFAWHSSGEMPWVWLALYVPLVLVVNYQLARHLNRHTSAVPPC